MPDRQSHAFTISSQHRSDLGVGLLPGESVVATLAMRPRAQVTREEYIPLGSGAYRHQWGLGIGPDPCNKLYVMHRANQTDFADAHLIVILKSNPGQTLSEQCHNHGYGHSTTLYRGSDLGVMVICRSGDGLSLAIRAYDLVGATLLTSHFVAPVPDYWDGDCSISLRGDNCFATGVITT